MPEPPQGPPAERVLKRDGLGRVELVRVAGRPRVRRVACGGRAPGSRLVARLLLARERRALAALRGVEGVPALLDGGGRDALEREYAEGLALHEATRLPRDFFERLEELVRRVHARGVCHNDLHKEQNVLVRADGRPALVDFQLASVHPGRGRAFEGRAREDLRHVDKHRRRYERRGARKPPGEPRARRSLTAWAWRRLAKPVYNVAAGALGLRDGEPRRASSGPWPQWTDPVGPAPGGAGGSSGAG